MIEASFNFYAVLNFWRSNEKKTKNKITPVRKVTFIIDRDACLSTFNKETTLSEMEKEACLPAEEPEFYAPAIKKEFPVKKECVASIIEEECYVCPVKAECVVCPVKKDSTSDCPVEEETPVVCGVEEECYVCPVEEECVVCPVIKDFTSDCPVEEKCVVCPVMKETLSTFTIEETLIVPLIENKFLIDETSSVCAIEEESSITSTIEEESAVLAKKDPIVTSTDQKMYIVSTIEEKSIVSTIEKESPELVSTFKKESPVVSLQKEKTFPSYTEECSGAVILEKASYLRDCDALSLSKEPLDISKSVSIPVDMTSVTVKELCGSDKESPASTVQNTSSTVLDNEEKDKDGALRGLVDAIAGIISGPDIIPAVDNYLDSLNPKIPLNRIDSSPSTLNTGKGYIDQVTDNTGLSFLSSIKHHVHEYDESDLIIEVINRNEVEEESEESSRGMVSHNEVAYKSLVNEELVNEEVVNVEVVDKELVDNCLVDKVVGEDSVHVERNGQSASCFSRVKALFKKWFCCTVDESSIIV